MCYHVAEILESHIYQFDLLSVHVVMGESVDAINIQSEFTCKVGFNPSLRGLEALQCTLFWL